MSPPSAWTAGRIRSMTPCTRSRRGGASIGEGEGTTGLYRRRRLRTKPRAPANLDSRPGRGRVALRAAPDPLTKTSGGGRAAPSPLRGGEEVQLAVSGQVVEPALDSLPLRDGLLLFHDRRPVVQPAGFGGVVGLAGVAAVGEQVEHALARLGNAGLAE